MTPESPGHRWTLAPLGASVSLVLMTMAACGPAVDPSISEGPPTPVTVESSYESYPTVGDLSGAADGVVIGVVGEMVDTFLDDGCDPQTDPSTGKPFFYPRMDVFEVKVERWLSGESKIEVIRVVSLDPTSVVDSEWTPFVSGERLLLFLVRNVPCGESIGEVWVPLSADNGVFDMTGDVVVPRSDNVTGLASPAGDRASGAHQEAISFLVEEVAGLSGG
jgi:hypothetical protein